MTLQPTMKLSHRLPSSVPLPTCLLAWQRVLFAVGMDGHSPISSNRIREGGFVLTFLLIHFLIVRNAQTLSEDLITMISNDQDEK